MLFRSFVSPGTTYDETIKKILEVQKTYTISFKKTTAALKVESEEHAVPFDGVVTDIVMNFPSGCEFLVDVRLIYMAGKTEHFIMPSVDGSFIALDDSSPHFRVQYPVRAKDRLRVEWWNYDGGNSHCVPVIVTLMGRGV